MEYQPTAAGNVAFEAAVRARPDGYTLLAGSDSLSINGSLFPRLSFDPAADFDAVVETVRAPLLCAVRADSPFLDLASLVAAARTGQVAVGSNGNGTLGHLLGEVLQPAVGVRWTHVPCRGGALAINDLLGGSPQAIIVYSGALADHVRSGRMRGVFLSSAPRHATLPEVPSLPEAGYRGGEIVGWHGLVAPRGTDPAIIARLHREVRVGLTQPEFALRVAALGMEAGDGAPETLATRIQREAARWCLVIEAGRIAAD